MVAALVQPTHTQCRPVPLRRPTVLRAKIDDRGDNDDA